MVQHRARGAAADAVRPVAIERVLADIEIEGREIGGAESVDGRIDAGPVMGFHRAAQPARRAPPSRCSTQRSSSGISASGRISVGAKPSRLPSSQRSVLRRRRYSSACCLRISGPMRRSSVVSDDHHPEAQDVGAVLLLDLLRRDDVAERLRHLAALLVEHEAVRQHRLERRPAARADGFQQRGMEPAAMLVRAFEIEIGRPGQAARLQHEGVGRAAFEPDIDDVASPARSRPGSRSWPRKRSGGEAYQASAPSSRNASTTRATTAGSRSGSPVARWTKIAIGTPQARWRLMHQSGRAATMLPMRLRPGIRHEMGLGDRRQRAGADVLRPVHADEPLRRGAVDQRRLGAPGMRVGMHELAAREQRRRPRPARRRPASAAL